MDKKILIIILILVSLLVIFGLYNYTTTGSITGDFVKFAPSPSPGYTNEQIQQRKEEGTTGHEDYGYGDQNTNGQTDTTEDGTQTGDETQTGEGTQTGDETQTNGGTQIGGTTPETGDGTGEGETDHTEAGEKNIFDVWDYIWTLLFGS